MSSFDNTIIQVLIYKNNDEALALAKILPLQSKFQSKHYHTKNVWFWEEIVKHGIKLLKTPSLKQLGD